jgi:uracil-DNA glycosylase
VRCAPPDNKPTPQELPSVRNFLDREIAGLKKVKVVVALGKIGFDAYLELPETSRLATDPAGSLQAFSLQTWRQLPVTRW